MKKLLILVVMLALPLTTFAAEITPESLNTFYWRIAMFVVFMALLIFFTRKPILNILKGRTEQILAELNEAEEARKAALAQVTEYKEKMVQLENELKEMKTNAKKIVEAEREAMLNDAKRQVEQMKTFAKNMIEAETTRAKAELHDEIVKLAIQEAEKIFKKELDGEKANQMLNDYVKRIGE